MPTVGEFLIDRLQRIGVKSVFGIPGDYILDFYDQLTKSPIEVVGTTSEAGAGFAADAYARLNGVGCVCVTYSVGGLSICNAVACAYAEKSPVIVISGSPGMKERQHGELLHHMVGHFNCQADVYSNITIAQTVLDNPAMAGYEIDRVIELMKHYKQPVYIELPRDMVNRNIKYDPYSLTTPSAPKSNPDVLLEAVQDAVAWINKAENPVILAGIEISRFNLGQQLLDFAEKTNIPVATTILSKSVFDETHPLSIGVSGGVISKESVKEIVDNTDCLIMLGVMQTDMNMGFLPLKCKKKNIISCTSESLQIRTPSYEHVTFCDFIKTLSESDNLIRHNGLSVKKVLPQKYIPMPSQKITSSRLFEKINSILTDDNIIIADVGDSLFGSIDLVVHDTNSFISPAFYTTMGFAVPAALGAQKACPGSRPIVIVGDGAFQMTGMEISTIASHHLNPIIFVLNNGCYATEKMLRDGPFNYIPRWSYHRMSDLIENCQSFLVETESDLESSVEEALKQKAAPSLIDVRLEASDITPALRRLTTALAKRVDSCV